MVTYIIRRLLWSVLLLFVVSFITFVMFIVLPSADPAVLRAGRQPTPELIAAIRENLGLDKPWYVQYLVYMRDLVFHFDFGYSYQNNIAVRETIFDRLPATASLALGAAVTWLLIGIPIGIISAIKRGTLLDRAAMGFALMAISAPVYWVGQLARGPLFHRSLTGRELAMVAVWTGILGLVALRRFRADTARA